MVGPTRRPRFPSGVRRGRGGARTLIVQAAAEAELVVADVAELPLPREPPLGETIF